MCNTTTAIVTLSGALNSKEEGGAQWRMTRARKRIAASCPEPCTARCLVADMSQICIIWDMTKLICANCRKTFEAVRRDAVTCSLACRKARERRLRALTPPLPTGTFDLLLVDQPVAWFGWSQKGEGRSPQRHYPTMDIAAMCRLGAKVAPLMAKHSVAGFWVYGRLFDMEAVIKAFGFDYSSDGFAESAWIKLTKDGRPRMVLGKTTRKGKETLLLAKRGKGLKRVDKGVRQVIFAPPGRHSEKPQQIHEGLERLYGDVRRLELFARRERFGWTPWGNGL
jgi:N6-adenosine-specific RNA methylase IME4